MGEEEVKAKVEGALDKGVDMAANAKASVAAAKARASAEVYRAKTAALRAVNAEEKWVDRHPTLTGWIITGLIVVILVLAVRGCR